MRAHIEPLLGKVDSSWHSPDILSHVLSGLGKGTSVARFARNPFVFTTLILAALLVVTLVTRPGPSHPAAQAPSTAAAPYGLCSVSFDSQQTGQVLYGGSDAATPMDGYCMNRIDLDSTVTPGGSITLLSPGMVGVVYEVTRTKGAGPNPERFAMLYPSQAHISLSAYKPTDIVQSATPVQVYLIASAVSGPTPPLPIPNSDLSWIMQVSYIGAASPGFGVCVYPSIVEEATSPQPLEACKGM